MEQVENLESSCSIDVTLGQKVFHFFHSNNVPFVINEISLCAWDFHDTLLKESLCIIFFCMPLNFPCSQGHDFTAFILIRLTLIHLQDAWNAL